MLKLQHIQELGFSVKEIGKRIFLIENFLTEEEVQELLSIAEAATQEEWEGAYLDNMKDFCQSKFGRTDIDNLVAEGKLEITSNWHDKILKIDRLSIAKKINKKLSPMFESLPGIGSAASVGIIQRQYEGVALTEHVDNHTDPSLVYASVAYINEDYNGGEVFFSNFGISFSPKAGSLIIFPTSEEWSHGVTEVEAGPVRYVLPIFISQDDFYKNNKY